MWLPSVDSDIKMQSGEAFESVRDLEDRFDV